MDDLNKLKNAMDDTVLTDIHMDKLLKGKIMKSISKENKKQSFFKVQKKWNIKIGMAYAVTLCLLFMISSSYLQSSGNNELREQQIDLLSFHSDVLSILKTQVILEKKLVNTLNSRDYTIEELEVLKEQATQNSIIVSENVKTLTVPHSIQSFEPQLKSSLNYLAASYENRSHLLKTTNLVQWLELQDHNQSYPVKDVDYHLSFKKFEKSITKVYKELRLNEPNYWLEIDSAVIIDDRAFDIYLAKSK